MENLLKKIGTLCFVITLLLGLNISANAAGYTYPTYPGDENWEELAQDRMKLREALQIPEDVLKDMSTEELLETVLDYPCFNDLYYFESIQEGFELMASYFNGAQELLEREDVGELLAAKYEQLNFSNMSKRQVSSDVKSEISNLEILLAQPQVSETMTLEEADDVVAMIEKSTEAREDAIDVQGTYKAQTYYKSLAEQQGEEIKGVTPRLSVKTPNGSSVTVIIRDEYVTLTDQLYMNQEVTSSFPGVQIVAGGTSRYNCHSYAWYSQSSNNKYWINDPSKYWTDGSYALQSGKTPTKNGQRLYYANSAALGGTHSAYVSDYSGTLKLTSKWGDYPLVKHTIKACPYYYSDSTLKLYQR